MASFRTAFPSKFLKADDLGATRPIGTIATVDFEDIGTGQNKDNKLVVHFAESSLKAIVLNLINSETIAAIAGTDDYEGWPGCRIQLYATKTEFQGKRVPCIRICAPPMTAAKKTAAKKIAAPAHPPAPAELDDEMPTTDVGF
jgi:hypothetical protein